MRPLHGLLALAGGAMLMAACTQNVGPPMDAVTDFRTSDESIAEAIRIAAEDWARHGLDIANYVTVNQEPQAIPIEYATQEELHAACPKSNYPTLGGCSAYKDGKFWKMLLNPASPERIATKLRHELIHFLVPQAKHLTEDPRDPPGAIGVFDPFGTSPTITQADMDHLALYTKILPSEVPFT